MRIYCAALDGKEENLTQTKGKCVCEPLCMPVHVCMGTHVNFFFKEAVNFNELNPHNFKLFLYENLVCS